MKILFISDIHGNYPALKSLEPYFKQVDMALCLGDVTGYHCYVNEVVDFLREHGVITIQGNHDRYVFEGLETQTKAINESVRFGIVIAQKKLTENNRKWLEKLPTSLSFKADDCNIYCCHGSPWDVTNEYIYPDSDKLGLMDQFSFDVIAMGHTHREILVKTKKQIIMNPGSVGQARDYEGCACAKILDTRTMDVTVIHQEYDYMTTIRNSISQGAEDWVYKHFKTLTDNNQNYD